MESRSLLPSVLVILLLFWLRAVVVQSVASTGEGTPGELTYYDHEEMTAILKKVSANYPNFTRLYSIGKSVEDFTFVERKYSLTPDDDVLRHLASVYSSSHANMHLGKACPPEGMPSFPNGTTNGAAWYDFSGVRGIVKDENGNPVDKATLKVSNRRASFKTSSRGEYWRILRPGTYTLKVSAAGFHEAEVNFSVPEEQFTVLNVTLKSRREEEESEQLLH
ncbi:hypothetical protein V5799_015512 [Amblyomma americanum]|uniref:Carboxypeptidase D-like n=1 Tax=Amblyomma americanum TaxID=6943 RepID=A0AAQ4F930_AMBAM